MVYLSWLLVLAAVFLHAAARGPRAGLWAGVFLSLLVPVWVRKPVRSLNLDAEAFAVAGGFAARKFALGPTRLRASDLAILLVLLARVASVVAEGELRPLTIPELVREWLLPYLAGRWFLARADDLPRMTRVFAAFVVVLAAATLLEALARVNPFMLLTGKPDRGFEIRGGLRRAMGPCDHPIYLGLYAVLLLPFAIEAARLAARRLAPAWWRLLPLGLAVAVVCSMSRGPILAAVATVHGAWLLAIRRPAARFAAIAATLALVASALVFEDEIKAFSERLANETEARVEGRTIEIDGKTHAYTGSKHRYLQFLVYRDAIRDAGWFGHGRALKGVRIDDELQRYFFSIDCHYLLFHLQNGWTGSLAFALLAASSLLNLLRVARGDGWARSLAAAFAAALLAVSAAIFTVWFAESYAWLYLFVCGLSANLLDRGHAPRRRR